MDPNYTKFLEPIDVGGEVGEEMIIEEDNKLNRLYINYPFPYKAEDHNKFLDLITTTTDKKIFINICHNVMDIMEDEQEEYKYFGESKIIDDNEDFPCLDLSKIDNPNIHTISFHGGEPLDTV